MERQGGATKVPRKRKGQVMEIDTVTYVKLSRQRKCRDFMSELQVVYNATISEVGSNSGGNCNLSHRGVLQQACSVIICHAKNGHLNA